MKTLLLSFAFLFATSAWANAYSIDDLCEAALDRQLGMYEERNGTPPAEPVYEIPERIPKAFVERTARMLREGFGISEYSTNKAQTLALTREWTSDKGFTPRFFAELSESYKAVGLLPIIYQEEFRHASMTSLPEFARLTTSLKWLPDAIRAVFLAKHQFYSGRDILLWSGLWKNSPQNEEIRRILKNRIAEFAEGLPKPLSMYRETHENATLVLRWLLETSAGEEKRELTMIAQRLMTSTMTGFSLMNRHDRPWALNLISLIPFRQIPSPVRAQLEPWIRFEINPPVVSKKVKSLFFDSHYAGSCEMMAEGHVCYTLDARVPASGNYTPVVVDDVVVGAVKHHGEPSMLALRNVVDEEGRLMLVAGATYLLPQSYSMKSAVLRPEFMLVKPNRFLFNLEDDILVVQWLRFKDPLESNGPLPRSLAEFAPHWNAKLTESQIIDYWMTIVRSVQSTAIRLQSEVGAP